MKNYTNKVVLDLKNTPVREVGAIFVGGYIGIIVTYITIIFNYPFFYMNNYNITGILSSFLGSLIGLTICVIVFIFLLKALHLLEGKK